MKAQLFWKKSLRFHDAITGSGGDMLNDSTDLIIGLSLIACAGALMTLSQSGKQSSQSADKCLYVNSSLHVPP